MCNELVKRMREPCQYENCVLCQEAADAIDELSKRIGRAVELYNRGVEKSAMWEALEGISPEPPKEET